MKLDDGHLKELKELEKKAHGNEESLSSIHNIFVYASSLVLKNTTLTLAFIIIGIGFAFTYIYAFADFTKLMQYLDLYDPTVLETHVEEIFDSFARAFVIASLFQLIAGMVGVCFASHICSRNVDDAILPVDLANIFALLFSVLLSLFFGVFIKYLLITVGMLIIVPGIIFMLQMTFVQYIIIFERKGIMHAFSQSSKMMYGAKGNFLTFISYAFFAFTPVWLLDLYTGGISSIFQQDAMPFMKIVLALVSEGIRQYIWLVYSTGVCLLYLKRSSLS